MLDLVRTLEETDEGAEEWGSQILDVIWAFDKEVNDENSEEEAGGEMAEQSVDEVLSDEESEDEIIVPCKCARAIVAPSHVPVLVSITNSLSSSRRK